MKQYTIFSFSKRAYFVFFAILIVAGILGYAGLGKKSEKIQTVVVKKGTITRNITVTGKTKPLKNADLSFEKGGKVENIFVEVGSRVMPGQALVQLDSSELAAKREEAEARVYAEKAKLEELKKGTRPEEIAIQETELERAKSARDDAKRNLIDEIHNAYTTSDDAIRNKTDAFFSSPRSQNPLLNFMLADSQLKNDLERERQNIESLLNSWRLSLDTLSLASDLGLYAVTAETGVGRIKFFLEKAALALSALTANANLSQATIDGYKSDVSLARTNVTDVITGLRSAEQKLKNAHENIILEENKLALKKAGATKEQIDVQEAEMEQAQASFDAIRVQLRARTLISPLKGVVSVQDARLGEIVSANKNIVSIISENDLEIEAFIPEVDIGNIRVGNPARIAFDAFPGETFTGSVSHIDPGETVVNGVVNFKTSIIFGDSERAVHIRSGLSADVDIETAVRHDALILPQSALIENNRGIFIKKMDAGMLKEIPISAGIRSHDGLVEIIFGVSEGDIVLNAAIQPGGLK